MNRTRGVRADTTKWYNNASTALNRVLPSLYHDYANQRYYNSVDGETTFPFTAVRTGNAAMFNAQGDMVWAPANMVPDSQAMTITVAGSSVNSVITGTDGRLLKLFTADGANSNHAVFPATGSTCVLGMTYTISAVVASSSNDFVQLFTTGIVNGSAAANFKLSTMEYTLVGDAVAASITGIPGIGYRVSLTFIATTGNFGNICLVATTTGLGAGRAVAMVYSGTIVCGQAQVELADVNSPNAFISTTGSAYYGPRLDYDPETAAPRGILIEESRVNSVTNSGMVGGVAPSTIPTGWNFMSVTGITQTYNYGTEDGIPYIDVTYSGINTSGSTAFPTIFLGTLYGGVAASNGQSWTGSLYVRKISGSTNITTVKHVVRGRASGSLVSGQAVTTDLSDAAKLTVGRKQGTFTFTDPSITHVEHCIITSVLNGATYDITIRIGGPQLELGGSASSLIPTFGVSATRAADVLSATAGSWLTQASGTIYADFSHPTLPSGTYPAIFQIDDGTGNNRVQVFSQSNVSTTLGGARIDLAGVSQVNTVVVNTVPYFNSNRYALSYTINNVRMTLNSGAVVLESLVTVPTGLNTYRTGGTLSGTTGVRWIKEIRFYQTSSASDTQLQALTA
jgi:hypothetical protein